MKTLAERFWSHVDKSPGQGPKGDCWQWTASCNLQGYGNFNVGGKIKRASRIAFLLANGSIDDDLDVCHDCDNPPCMNPAHLWQGTPSQNLIDFVNKGKHYNTRKTHCRNGHLYSTENTKLYGRERVCRECAKNNLARHRQKKRLAHVASS